MNVGNTKIKKQVVHLVKVVFFAALFFILGTVSVYANHPVFVEGNCLGDGSAARTAVPPGTCGDYDGDGRIGTAEDTDMPFDRVFGTINAALGPTGVNQNGTVTIVASGIFPETVSLLANVTLQAAPGVEANIDAVLQGDPGSTARQGQPGIIVNSGSFDHYQVIRNITSKNWTSGIRVMGRSRVAIENCRLENNVNYGIEIADNARVTISKSEIHATGFRVNPMTGSFPGSSTPNPGKGIEFDDASSGTVFLTTVSGSFGAGISDVSSGSVCAYLVNVFDNSPNFQNVTPSATSCP
ncbi:hypothetical protein BH18ACI1_BH18ACI1_12020 [soil metagenome]